MSWRCRQTIRKFGGDDRPLSVCMSFHFVCGKTLRRQLSKSRTTFKPKSIVGTLRCMEATQVRRLDSHFLAHHLLSLLTLLLLIWPTGVPPSFTWTQTLWTFVGVLVTHTILSRLNYFIVTESADKLSLVLAPLGALTTLQYNLTPAPASQPRVAFFAQVFAITIANLISYIPFPASAAWFRTALAPAIVIPLMAKLGITHPPAGETVLLSLSCTSSSMFAQFTAYIHLLPVFYLKALLP